MSESAAVAAKPKDVSSKAPAEAKPKSPAKKSLFRILFGFDVPKTPSVLGGFKMDKEYMLVALLFFILLLGAYGHALQISAPEKVSIQDKTSFYVTITNDSDSPAEVKVNFYSPAKSQITAPKTILPNSSSQAKITVLGSASPSGEFDASIEAVSGQEIVKKNIVLSFEESEKSKSDAALSAFFSLGAFNNELGKLSPFEWVMFWIMVIIAAVLLVAFIARVNRRL